VTEEEALLAAIRDDPDDDTPRLVLADWYAENGQESRGEFIRTQIEQVARAKRIESTQPTDFLRETKTIHDLRRREERLWADGAHGVFIPGVASVLTTDYFGHLYEHQLLVFDRGFPREVRLTLARFFSGRCPSPRCDANTYPNIYSARCRVCDGTGEYPEFLPELFRWPITSVVITDRLPSLIHHSGGYLPPSWHGINEWDTPAAQALTSGWLPPALWGEVERQELHAIAGPGSVLSFDSVEDALAALSKGCIAYGRRKFEESRERA
jgi:uncharacterized protein (TIGR02996 family)